MGIQVGGEIFSDNYSLDLPERSGKLADEQYVQEHGGASYLVYTALLIQSNTDAPIATVLENTLGGTVVWTRDSVGLYIGTLVGAFPNLKCLYFFGNASCNSYKMEFDINTAPDSVYILVRNNNLIDVNLRDTWPSTSIEIRVYS